MRYVSIERNDRKVFGSLSTTASTTSTVNTGHVVLAKWEAMIYVLTLDTLFDFRA
jgi:hypothetical protein